MFNEFRSPMIHVTRRSSTASQTDSYDKYGTLDDTDLSVNSLTSVNSISSLLREKLLVRITYVQINISGKVVQTISLSNRTAERASSKLACGARNNNRSDNLSC